MDIGDTLQLSALLAPEGVEFFLGEGVDADEVTIATLSPPRVEEEPEPELEEEAELVGEEGEEVPRARRLRRARRPPRGEGEAAEGGGDSEEGSPVDLPPASPGGAEQAADGRRTCC